MWMWPWLDLLEELQGSFQSYWFIDSMVFMNEVWEEEFGEVTSIL